MLGFFGLLNRTMDQATIFALVIAALILIVALLYSTVGHAGASGYLAVMALFGVAPVVIKPIVLMLNIIVAGVGAIRFYPAGVFSWRACWPFSVALMPGSFIGGRLSWPVPVYKSSVGAVLLYSGVRLFFSAGTADSRKTTMVPIWIALLLGAAIGLLSGLTGVGGGIFLSPILLLVGWAKTKETSGVSAAFILVNSVAGLLGHISAVSYVPPDIIYWAPAALIGGWIGTELGTRLLPGTGHRRWRLGVLVFAGQKLCNEVILLLLHKRVPRPRPGTANVDDP